MTDKDCTFYENGLRREICHGLNNPYVCWTPIWRRIETCMTNKSISESFLREIWFILPLYLIEYNYGKENLSEDFRREMGL